MTAQDTAGLVEQIRAAAGITGDELLQAADDALEAMGRELAAEKEAHQSSSRAWRDQFEAMHQRALTAERLLSESQAEGRRLRAIIRAFEGGLVDNPPLAARDEGDGHG